MPKHSYVQSAATALYETTKALKESEAVEVVKRFVALLKKNGRLDLAPLILAEYEKLAAKSEDTVRLTTAEDLDSGAVKSLRAALALHQDGAGLVLKTDPSLIAGAVIRHGDTLLDASVKRKLELLKATLIA